jgi:kumamolisin
MASAAFTAAALLAPAPVAEAAPAPTAWAALTPDRAPTDRAPDDLVRLAGAIPPSPAQLGATVLGAAGPESVLHLELYLQPAGATGLQTLADAVSTPGNPAYHRFLTVPQFARRFGIPAIRVAALDRYLEGRGLRVGPLARDHLAQAVQGTAAELDGAFGTALVKLRTAAGGDVIGSTRAPGLPARLAGLVTFVDGLDPFAHQVNNLVRFPAARRQGQVDGACSGMAGAGLTSSQLASAYGFNGFYNRGDEGQGETIGLIEYALGDTQAVSQYEQCIGAALNVDYVPTATPPNKPTPKWRRTFRW